MRAFAMAEYKIKFEVFEGPLDLLLHLIKKEEVDIYEVNLTKLATQFIEYIEVMRMLDLEVAGEFLVMASTLMYIKSRELLPKDQQAPARRRGRRGRPALGTDPPTGGLQKIQGRRRAAPGARNRAGKHLSPPAGAGPNSRRPPPRKAGSLALRPDQRHQQRAETGWATVRGFREIFEDKWTVSEKIEYLMKLMAEQGVVKFSDLFAGASSRSEVVCTFLALLELIRLRQLICAQPEDFGEIEITRAPAQPAAA